MLVLLTLIGPPLQFALQVLMSGDPKTALAMAYFALEFSSPVIFIVQTIFGLVCVVPFLLRKRYVPTLLQIFFSFGFIYVAIDILYPLLDFPLLKQLDLVPVVPLAALFVDHKLNPAALVLLPLSMLQPAIGIAYVRRSQRVANTFVN